MLFIVGASRLLHPDSRSWLQVKVSLSLGSVVHYYVIL